MLPQHTLHDGFLHNSTATLAITLKVKALFTKSGYLTKSNKEYNIQALIDILSNDFYTGIVRHGDLKKEGTHKPLINKITFGKVQSKLKSISFKSPFSSTSSKYRFIITMLCQPVSKRQPRSCIATVEVVNSLITYKYLVLEILLL